jgi:hypothetical protein
MLNNGISSVPVIFYYSFNSLYTCTNLKTRTHQVWWDGGYIPDGDWAAGVGGLGALLEVGVTQVTADSLWEANLLAGIQKILVGQDCIWREGAKVLIG